MERWLKLARLAVQNSTAISNQAKEDALLTIDAMSTELNQTRAEHLQLQHSIDGVLTGNMTISISLLFFYISIVISIIIYIFKNRHRYRNMPC